MIRTFLGLFRTEGLALGFQDSCPNPDKSAEVSAAREDADGMAEHDRLLLCDESFYRGFRMHGHW